MTSPNCNARRRQIHTIPVATPENNKYIKDVYPNPERDKPVPVLFTMYKAAKNKHVPRNAAARCEFDLCIPLFAKTGDKPAKTAPSIA